MSPPAVTGVGSLPHLDVGEAVRFVLETTGVPYLPQLPGRHPEEGMLRQWGDGLCGVGASEEPLGLRYGKADGPRREAFRGAEALVASLPADTWLVKTQVTGPVTLAAAMLAAGHPGTSLWDELIAGLLERVEGHLGWLEASLPEAEILLVLDEPALAGLAAGNFSVSAADAEAVLRTCLEGVSIPVGLHCCADTDWVMVAGLRPAWLSWDLGALGVGMSAAAEPLAEAVMSGTRIIWGLVPSRPGVLPSDEDLIGRLRRAEAELVLGGADLVRLSSECLLSPGCGLAGLTTAQAKEVAGRVVSLAGQLATHG